jgi:hypothetical protein
LMILVLQLPCPRSLLLGSYGQRAILSNGPARACFGQTDSERFQQIKGFSGDHLKQSLPGLILFWSPSNAKLLFC